MKGAITVGIAGLGAIGRVIARKLANGEVPGVALGGVAVRDVGKAQAFLDSIGRKAPILGIERLARESGLVIECAPAAAFADIAVPVLAAGTTFMAISAGQLLERPDLVALAKETARRSSFRPARSSASMPSPPPRKARSARST
jgi:aspartate dehydrogenase